MKKFILVIMSSLLIFSLGIASTVAWLTAATDKIENTFTIGNIRIDLDEPTWFNGSVNKLVESKTGLSAKPHDNKLVPGKLLTKDPRAWVVAGSEKCYLFIKIECSAKLSGIITYAVETGWTKLEEGVYYRVVDASQADQSFSILKDNKIQCATSATSETLAGISLTNDSLSFTAYAVQFESMADAATAWNVINNK